MNHPRTGSNMTAGVAFGDRYEICEVLGEGGMATVYKAHHKLLDIPVAIKVIRPEHLLKRADSADMFRARFHREARLSLKLIHPNIVQSREFGEIPEFGCYMVMDYCQGEPLSQLLARSGPLPQPQAMGIVKQIAAAMIASHEAGVIHRDLKPENILISSDGHVWVLDFGIAKGRQGRQEVQELTKGGMMVGTPMYMSPEQAMGQDADARSDLYAMGLMFFEMLTGERPYTEVDPTRLLITRISKRALTLGEVRPDLPLSKELEGVIAQTLMCNPEERFDDVQDFLEALQACRGSQAPASAPASPSASPSGLTSTPAPSPRDLPVMPQAPRRRPAPSPPQKPRRLSPPAPQPPTEIGHAPTNLPAYSNLAAMLLGSGITLWLIVAVVVSLNVVSARSPLLNGGLADASNHGHAAAQTSDAGVPASEPALAQAGDAPPQP